MLDLTQPPLPSETLIQLTVMESGSGHEGVLESSPDAAGVQTRVKAQSNSLTVEFRCQCC